MNKKEKISVIIPVYNVEPYLEKCLNTVLNQTYKNLEIILVNDGSTDNSPTICDEYAKKDTRVKVIHKKNGGLSDARNKGIEISTGEYITFVDSDDYLDIHMLEELYKVLKKDKSDIAICNIKNIYPNGKEVVFPFKEKHLLLDSNNKYYYLYNSYSTPTIIACAKLYKREIFKSIRYPKGKVHEDEAIIVKILNIASKISYIDKPLYLYYQRENSITKTFNLKRLDILTWYQERINFFKEQKLDNELLKLQNLAYIKVLVKTIIPGLKSLNNEQEKVFFYKKEVKNTSKYIKTNFKLTIKEKIILYLLEKHQLFYLFLYKNIKKIK